MIPFLFAASLNVATPANVTPNRRNILTLKGAALLSGSSPGKYKISAHMPVSLEKSNLVGDPIPSVRISPPTLRLRAGKSRNFVAHVPVADGYDGPIYLCIMTDEPPRKTVGINLVSRSCYRRIVAPR